MKMQAKRRRWKQPAEGPTQLPNGKLCALWLTTSCLLFELTLHSSSQEMGQNQGKRSKLLHLTNASISRSAVSDSLRPHGL